MDAFLHRRGGSDRVLVENATAQPSPFEHVSGVGVGGPWLVCPPRAPARQVHVTLSDSPVQPHPDPSWAPLRVEVVGVPLAVIDYDRTLDRIDAMVAARRRGYVCACNTHTVTASHEDPELRAALLSGDALNVPDGMPLVWALNALGNSLRDR